MQPESSHPEAWIQLLVLVLVSGVGLTLWPLRHDRRELLPALGVVLGSAAVALGVWFGVDVPTEWITVLHEGTQLDNLMQVLGTGHHAGSLWSALVNAIHPGPLRLEALVRFNLALTVLMAGAFVGLGRALGSWPRALLFTTVLLPGPMVWSMALSEVPGPLIGLLLALAGVVMALHRASPSRWVLGWLAGVALALSQLRIEVLPVLLLPAAWLGLRHLGLEHRFDRAYAQLWPAGAWSATRKATVVAVVVVSLVARNVAVTVAPSTNVSWVLLGLGLLHPSMLLLPVTWALHSSLALAALVIAGAVAALRRGGPWALWLLGTVVAWRVCYAASHLAPFEIARYSAALLPAVFALAVLGVEEARGWFAALPHSGWALGLGLVLLAAAPPVNGSFRGYFSGAPPKFLQGPRQQEVRLLLEVLGAAPECRVYTRIIDRPGHDDGGWRWAHYDLTTRRRLIVGEAPTGEGCERFYRGTDCNRTDVVDDCLQYEVGEPLAQREVREVQYNDPVEWGQLGYVRLALYALPQR